MVLSLRRDGAISEARILVVDDQDSWVRLISEVLYSWGAVRVASANSVSQAIDYVTATPVDLVITDLIMPNEDGLALIRWLRRHKDPAQRRTKIILLTADPTQQNVARAGCCGVDMVMEKPIRLPVFHPRLEHLLNRELIEERRPTPCDRVLTAACPLIPASSSATDAA